jgi:hypothetical protein
MIVFELACACGYIFEGWFQDRHDFESQHAAAYLVCPECGSHKIRKILSPVSFQLVNQPLAEKSPETPSTETDQLAEVQKALKTLQKFVEKNFEDVGTDLAKESLKIHYGVSESRNIRGVTTEAEEKNLKKEGIELFKIPMPAKDRKIN